MKLHFLIRQWWDNRKFSKTPGVSVASPFYVEFKERVIFRGLAYVGPGAYWSAKGGIDVGRNVIFGPRCTIWTYSHDYNSSLSIPYGGSDICKPVIIEDNVWLGLGCVVMPGVRIGEGAVVAAGSVLTKDVPACAVVAGNPAVIKKYRDAKTYFELKESKRFYLSMKAAGQLGELLV